MLGLLIIFEVKIEIFYHPCSFRRVAIKCYIMLLQARFKTGLNCCSEKYGFLTLVSVEIVVGN
jgi:hypothetical protein